MLVGCMLEAEALHKLSCIMATISSTNEHMLRTQISKDCY